MGHLYPAAQPNASGSSAKLPPVPEPAPRARLATVARDWLRIGLTGFGGPPAHISLLRDLMVQRRHWIEARTFEDANAACSLLPGPASTQLAILCAYRVAGAAGAIVGGLGFIVPAVVMVIVGSTFVLAHAPPLWLRGAGARSRGPLSRSGRSRSAAAS